LPHGRKRMCGRASSHPFAVPSRRERSSQGRRTAGAGDTSQALRSVANIDTGGSAHPAYCPLLAQERPRGGGLFALHVAIGLSAPGHGCVPAQMLPWGMTPRDGCCYCGPFPRLPRAIPPVEARHGVRRPAVLRTAGHFVCPPERVAAKLAPAANPSARAARAHSRF
jgi:hypothetical protein